MAVRLISSLAVIAVIVFAFFSLKTRPDGRLIFEREGCPGCHAFKGLGRGIDLSGVSSVWSDERLRDQIVNPRRSNPQTGMPNFGHLSKKEGDALIEYLKGS